MVIELDKWQLWALGLGAVCWGVQTWGGWKVSQANDALLEVNKKLHDQGNRAAYLSMYLLVKLEENDVELSEFDRQVLANPPKLVDADNPNLFSEYLEYCDEHGYTEDTAREFMNRLKQIREEDE